jgi:hypothetical protein
VSVVRAAVGTRLLAAFTLVALCLAVAACGGGSDSTTTTAADPGGQATGEQEEATVKAEANCRLMLREVQRAVHGLLSAGYKNNLQLVTIGFGKPGLEVARRTRARQRKLVDAIDNKAFETYVGLFDPIILFAQQSLEAARIEDVVTVANLKEKLTTLGAEQGIVAGEAGLPACEVDFLDAMVKAASP